MEVTPIELEDEDQQNQTVGAVVMLDGAQAAPHMATQWGPPKTPIIKAVMAKELCIEFWLECRQPHCQRCRTPGR